MKNSSLCLPPYTHVNMLTLFITFTAYKIILIPILALLIFQDLDYQTWICCIIAWILYYPFTVSLILQRFSKTRGTMQETPWLGCQHSHTHTLQSTIEVVVKHANHWVSVPLKTVIRLILLECPNHHELMYSCMCGLYTILACITTNLSFWDNRKQVFFFVVIFLSR